MAHQMYSNVSCLDIVKHAYHTCADHAADTVTSSLEWSYASTIGRVVQQGLTIDRSVFLSVAACVLVAAILYSCVQFVFNSSFRHELHETLEIIVSLFTAHLSFAALLINSVWFFGQVLAGVCDLLTLNPRWLHRWEQYIFTIVSVQPLSWLIIVNKRTSVKDIKLYRGGGEEIFERGA